MRRSHVCLAFYAAVIAVVLSVIIRGHFDGVALLFLIIASAAFTLVARMAIEEMDVASENADMWFETNINPDKAPPRHRLEDPAGILYLGSGKKVSFGFQDYLESFEMSPRHARSSR